MELRKLWSTVGMLVIAAALAITTPGIAGTGEPAPAVATAQGGGGTDNGPWD